MRKPHEFYELSDISCSNSECRNRIKANVVARKLSSTLIACWKCWIMETRNMTLASYKKYRAARARARAEGGDPQSVIAKA